MYPSILFLLSYFNFLPIKTELCSWLLETVDFISLVPAHDHYMGILQEQLLISVNSWDMLKYMLKITAGCNGKTDHKLMNSLTLQGVSPSVQVIINSDQNKQQTTYEYDLIGILMPINDSSTESCNEATCLSSWFVPFPIHNSSISARVIISSGGVGYHNFYLDTELDVAHLFHKNIELNSHAVPFKNAIEKLLELAPLYVDVNPENEITTSISLLPKHSVVLLATSDFHRYFFTEVIPNETNFSRVCLKSRSNIHSAMFFPTMNLIGTKFGLLAQKRNEFRRVSSICVDQMSTESDNQTQTVLITASYKNAKDKCGSVAMAEISSKTVWPEFVEIKDHWASDIHRFCQLKFSFDCCLVSSALADKATRFYFLVLNEQKDVYHVLEFNRIKKIWSKVCSLNATVYLSRILVHDTIAEAIVFAYGSDILICQRRRQLLIDIADTTTEQDIIQLITLHDDYFMFLRREKQIGLGQIGLETVSYLSKFWSRDPLNLDDLVAMYKTPSGSPLVLKSFVKSTGDIDLKLMSLDFKSYIEQFNYNNQMRQGQKNQDCTIEKLVFNIENMTKFTGIKLIPSENSQDSVYNSKEALYLYQGIASFITTQSINPESKKSGYHSLFQDIISEWQYEQDSIVFTSLSELKEKIEKRPAFELQGKSFKQVYEREYDSNFGLPSTIYLDIGDVFIAQVSIYYSSDHSYSKEPINILLSSPDIQVDYLEVSKASQIRTYEIKIKGLYHVYKPNPAGADLISAVVEFRFPDDNEKSCVQSSIEPQGKYKVRAMLGCPPSKHLLFNWAETVNLNKFHFEGNYDCLRPVRYKPCFNFYGDFNPVFTLFDDVSGIETIYTDPLIFLAIGGGAAGEGIRLFSQKEIIDYNFLNGSEHHAIWRLDHHEHDSHDHDEHDDHHRRDINLKRRVLSHPRVSKSSTLDAAVPLVQYGGKAIHWLCEWHSPCGNVDPEFPDDAQYDVLIEVTNRGLKTNITSCDLTLRFVVRIHGLPASLIHKALPQLAIAVVFIILLCILYHCFRTYRKKLNNELSDVD